MAKPLRRYVIYYVNYPLSLDLYKGWRGKKTFVALKPICLPTPTFFFITLKGLNPDSSINSIYSTIIHSDVSATIIASKVDKSGSRILNTS